MTHYEQTEDLGDLSGVSAEDQYTPIPPGQYIMQAIKTELKESSKGGKYVSAQFEVLGPDHVGRKVFENYNIMNANPQTVEIALKQIKQWVIACGYTGNERLTMALLQDLEGKEFLAQVKVEADRTGQYGDKNRIVRYLAATDIPPMPTQAPGTHTQAADYAKASGRSPAHTPAATPRGGNMPWITSR